MLSRSILALSAIAICVALSCGARASTVKSWTDDDSFNSDSIKFAGFTANQLTSIGGTGTYEGVHGHSTIFTLSIDLNNHWTTIDTWTVPKNNTTETLLSSLSVPINFALGTVTGIKLTASRHDGNDSAFDTFYHYGRCDYDYDRDCNVSAESFTFNVVIGGNGDPGGTPIPAALPLFVTGLGALGLLARRKKRKNAAALAAV